MNAAGRRRRRNHALALSARIAAAALAMSCALALPGGNGKHRSAQSALAHAALPDVAAASVRIRGGPELSVLTRRSVDRLLATQVGARLRERLASGVLAGPVTIEINVRGEDFTRYRVPGEELGETIVFDPWTLPLVDTEAGRLRATRESVLAHEFGHAVLKLRSEDAVIREVENPVRLELGLPRRVRF